MDEKRDGEMHATAYNEDMCRVHVELTSDQADALMHLLLNAAPDTVVSEEMADALLRALADAQRSLVRRRLQMESGGVAPSYTAH